MKNYSEVARSVLNKSQIIIEKKKHKRENIIRMSYVIIPGFCIFAIILSVFGMGLFENNFFGGKTSNTTDNNGIVILTPPNNSGDSTPGGDTVNDFPKFDPHYSCPDIELFMSVDEVVDSLKKRETKFFLSADCLFFKDSIGANVMAVFNSDELTDIYSLNTLTLFDSSFDALKEGMTLKEVILTLGFPVGGVTSNTLTFETVKGRVYALYFYTSDEDIDGPKQLLLGEWMCMQSGGFEFVLNSNGTSYSVKGLKDSTVTELTIPAEYNGLPVTKIYTGAFSGNLNITTVTLPSTVTEIGTSAFAGCEKLVSVYMSENVKKINDYAFSECSSLKNLGVTMGVEELGKYAFFKCESLETVNFPAVKALQENVFGVCTSLTSGILTGAEKIEGIAFKYCSSLTHAYFSSDLKSIEYRAFFSCSEFTDIVFMGSEEEWNAVTKADGWCEKAVNVSFISDDTP